MSLKNKVVTYFWNTKYTKGTQRTQGKKIKIQYFVPVVIYVVFFVFHFFSFQTTLFIIF